MTKIKHFTDLNGTTKYWKGLVLHREDGPAIEYLDGSKSYYYEGVLHRVDGPAVEYSDGHKEWFINGKRHREDGPAVEQPDGFRMWYLNNEQLNTEWQIDNPNWSSLNQPELITVDVRNDKVLSDRYKEYPALLKSMIDYLNIKDIHDS